MHLWSRYFHSFLFQVEDYSNKIANVFLSLQFKHGDTIALLMENRPEYVATWLGLAKIGVIPALINHNQKAQALVHAIQVAKSKALIYGSEFESGLLNRTTYHTCDFCIFISSYSSF